MKRGQRSTVSHAHNTVRVVIVVYFRYEQTLFSVHVSRYVHTHTHVSLYTCLSKSQLLYIVECTYYGTEHNLYYPISPLVFAIWSPWIGLFGGWESLCHCLLPSCCLQTCSMSVLFLGRGIGHAATECVMCVWQGRFFPHPAILFTSDEYIC